VTTKHRQPPQAIWSTELELSNGSCTLAPPSGLVAAYARVLVRFHGESIDCVLLPLANGSIAVKEILLGLGARPRARLRAHLAQDGFRGTAADVAEVDWTSVDGCRGKMREEPKVSVVVCTRDRSDILRDCLTRLQRLEYDNLEVVIVDNAPSSHATRAVFDEAVSNDVRFRYALEPRTGLSHARNRGLAEATGKIVAFTDDDVGVDAAWVGALVRGFSRRPDIACVTGMVCAASLETPAERFFDAKVSWATSCEQRIYDVATQSAGPLYPYAAGLFGTGANMAFRTSALLSIGGFDEALGAGTRTAGGEDLDIFLRTLQAGYALAYEPSALVWHYHRSSMLGLRRQMFGYGSGLTAFVTKHVLQRQSRRAIAARIPRGLAHLTVMGRESRRSGVNSGHVRAHSLLLRELAGAIAGPYLYVASRRHAAVGAVPKERAE